jgi:hypothetical protein
MNSHEPERTCAGPVGVMDGDERAADHVQIVASPLGWSDRSDVL